jgi:hypothetical protein
MPKGRKDSVVKKKKRKKRIADYSRDLRGLATNRYGGNQLQRERGLRGSSNLPSGPVYTYSEKERREYEREMQHQRALNDSGSK